MIREYQCCPQELCVIKQYRKDGILRMAYFSMPIPFHAAEGPA